MEAGRAFVSVDPKDTSQICSKCGEYVEKSLRVRIHRCPECGLKVDRDLNGAINILRRGLTGNPSPASRGESPGHTARAQQRTSNATLGVI
jgi:putative transposase